jgi:hypothetical protein
MTVKKEDPLADIKEFESNTDKEVTIWDWLGRILPSVVLAIIVVLKVFSLDTALNMVLDIAVIIFFVICIIWWYWAIHKIARTVRYIRESQEKFISLSNEIKKFKSAFKSDNTRS